MSDTLRDPITEAPGLTPPQALDAERSILAPASELRSDPHLEMHTRGG